MLKKLFSHTAIYGLAPQVVKIAQLFALPLITPYLTKDDYGINAIILAVTGSVSVFASLGLGVVLANSFTKSTHQYKWLWRQIYGFLICWNLLYAVLITVIIYLFIPPEASDKKWIIIFLNVSPLVLFASSGLLGGLYYQLSQKPMQVAVRSVLIGVLAIILNVYFIKYQGMGYMGWFWTGTITGTLMQLSYWYALNFKLGIKPIYNFKRKTIIRQIKICLPTIPHYYSGYLLNTFDKVIMRFYALPTAEVGRYAAAQTPSRLFESGTLAANQAIGPLLLQTYKNNDKLTERKLNFTVIIVSLCATSIVCLFMKELLPLIIKTAGMEDIYKIAIILVMGYNYRPMYVAANNKLFYVEKTKALLKVTTIASLISVGLNLITLYFFGVQAAAITLFISFMYMGYSGFFIKEFKESAGTNHHPILWLCLTLLLTSTVYLFSDWGIIVKLIIGGIITLLLLILLLLVVYKNFLK